MKAETTINGEAKEIFLCDFCGMSSVSQKLVSNRAGERHICQQCAVGVVAMFEPDLPKFLTEEEISAGPNPSRKTKEAAHG